MTEREGLGFNPQGGKMLLFNLSKSKTSKGYFCRSNPAKIKHVKEKVL